MNPEISVIILTYNQEGTIGRTIESVLSQKDVPEYEIIVGEDASTDSTRRVCLEYQEKYPGIIRLMPAAQNKGITRNYRDCLIAARGRYIADCSGDDYWTDNSKLRREFDVLETNPDVSIVYSSVCDDSKFVTPIIQGRRMLELMLDATGIPPIVLSAAMYRRDSIVRSPDFNRIFSYYCEDYPVIACLLSQGNAYKLEGETLCYEMSTESSSRPSDSVKSFRNTMNAIEMRLSLAERYDVDKEALKNFQDENLTYAISIAFYTGSASLRDDFNGTVKRLNLKLPKKARIYRALMRFDLSRKIAAGIKDVLQRRHRV